MTHEIEYTERARLHLLETIDWIAERSPDAAERWAESLFRAIEGLRKNPERFGFDRENGRHDFEIRRLLFGKRRGQYRILFTINGNRVIILDVRHSLQDWLEPGELDS
ncbi:MAG: type II toxin-antitoxin system RelE/ParE family toxin [Verrucomicrobiae bacterium]|nr:type II toxin-antitoxin system RelE/ParE family toxin [Verrucomicrobiae bacterium]MCB1087686.1 type II toxin-antitoxin system RelE/ParE family toxin [Verrucomicrobiae bacterium]MCB1090071.1 type II toxin-antitoxin system RelE/ParE family toxin [Verrucomicrobiae bacterium]